MDDHGLVTVGAAAAKLARSTEQVRRYLREGRLHGRRIGGQWFIEQSALDSFHDGLREQTGFLQNIRPASELDPLSNVIGIGHGGGSSIAEGKEAYRRAFRWRR